MKSRIALSFALALALVFQMTGFAFAKSTTVVAANPLKNMSVTDTTGNLTGAVLSITRFAVKNGQVMAVGTLTGTVTRIVNGQQVTEQITREVMLPVSVQGTTCDVLHLELGPLDLDLLGLVVHLDRIVLDIDAQSGPGNLLGNLLCSVAGLLDGNGRALGKLAGLLNDILAALG